MIINRKGLQNNVFLINLPGQSKSNLLFLSFYQNFFILKRTIIFQQCIFRESLRPHANALADHKCLFYKTQGAWNKKTLECSVSAHLHLGRISLLNY